MQDKISVIIPTIQKANVILQHLINILEEDNAVSEIIIINNALKDFNPQLIGNKLKIHVPKKNLYVNQSWNYGVKVAENDKFLIINDDIICGKNLCTEMLETGMLDRDDVGLIGVHNSWINNLSGNIDIDTFLTTKIKENKKIYFIEQTDHIILHFWGVAIFGNKSSYYPIPDIFKIIWGDNYLLYRNKQHGKINYCMAGHMFNHMFSSSSTSKEFIEILKSDVEAAQMYFGVITGKKI